MVCSPTTCVCHFLYSCLQAACYCSCFSFHLARINPHVYLSLSVGIQPYIYCLFMDAVVHSALEELSKKKAEKTGPFAKPKMLVTITYMCVIVVCHLQMFIHSAAVASKIMSKYGWEEGQGTCVYINDHASHRSYIRRSRPAVSGYEHCTGCREDKQTGWQNHQCGSRKR